jgi:hypothetical protein
MLKINHFYTTRARYSKQGLRSCEIKKEITIYARVLQTQKILSNGKLFAKSKTLKGE